MTRPSRELTEHIRKSIGKVGVMETARRAGVHVERIVRLADGLSIASFALKICGEWAHSDSETESRERLEYERLKAKFGGGT